MRLLIFSIFFTFPLFALYNGNPREPAMPELGIWTSTDDWWGIKLDYEWDQVYEKKIKVEERVSSKRERFDRFFSQKNEGLMVFNISDRIEIYGKLGAMKLNLSQRPNDEVRLNYRTDHQFLWGFGGRVILVYWEEVVMGVNALYSGSFMRISEILENGRPRKASGARFKYSEWQVGISFSREMGIFNPYIGLAYSSLHSRLYNVPDDSSFTTTIADEDLETREPFIFLLGLGLTKGKNIGVNLESRLGGEKGMSLTGSIRF